MSARAGRGGVILLRVKVSPGSRAGEAVTRTATPAAGAESYELCVRVTGRAVAGAANADAVTAVAALLRLPRSAVSIVRGAAARDKVLAISGSTLQSIEAVLSSVPLA